MSPPSFQCSIPALGNEHAYLTSILPSRSGFPNRFKPRDRMHEMSRKLRSGVADAVSDLALREILYVKQTGSSQIGVGQEGATKIGIIENCAT